MRYFRTPDKFGPIEFGSFDRDIVCFADVLSRGTIIWTHIGKGEILNYDELSQEEKADLVLWKLR